ncbi:hypothetical protein LPJ53_004208 [Coemansia erecta]|uniref:Transcription activator GCR1-like domain-containing protein n=1 Tax=Coemansia erecta TaxID=147472 RepID=A0A9W7XXM5_9FUNG|nr:hypothetical protein LPJ53_004208 [Coemansia erecta]
MAYPPPDGRAARSDSHSHGHSSDSDTDADIDDNASIAAAAAAATTSTILSSVALLSINPATPHPDAGASDRERLLWSSLAKAYSEIREMQAKINRLLEMNLRYAEQLHQAIAIDVPKKRAKLPKPPSAAAASAAAASSAQSQQPQTRPRAQTMTHVQNDSAAVPLVPQAQTQTQTQTNTQQQQQQPVSASETDTSLQAQLPQPSFLTQPFQSSAFPAQQYHPFQALHAAHQQEQLQRRLNSALYLDHQNQQRFRSISSSSISLQQALAHARGLNALAPGFRNGGAGSTANVTGAENSSAGSNALQMLSQQVLQQCTAAMPPVVAAPVATAPALPGIHPHQLVDPATSSQPSMIMPLSAPITPLTGAMTVSGSASAHTAPSLSISGLSSARDKFAQPRQWRPPRADAVGQTEPSIAEISAALEEEPSPEPMQVDSSSIPASARAADEMPSPPMQRRNSTTPRRRLSLESMLIGDPEQIPSIGKFENLRQLYEYKQRCREHDAVHGTHWREKMDSKRRQNWSRITAVYNRIVQLRGPGSNEADLERALSETDGEMQALKMTLTRYSQIVRKKLNNERRTTAAAAAAAAASASAASSSTAAPVPGGANQGVSGFDLPAQDH